MNQKINGSALLLFAALLFGAAARFYPVAASGFPLNDGGMFYAMFRDLQANHYLLPQFTTYNALNIPFAYPPLGFYVAAALSALLPVSDLQISLWLPAFVNTLCIFFFYKLAEQILPSRISAALATLIYALSPRAFLWQVMGGGITRAFGMAFLLLTLWQVVQLFKTYSHKKLALTILFGAGAVLSHPQTALHTVLGCALLFAFYGRSKRGVASALLVGLGVAALTSAWWGTVLARHGLETFLSAGQTSRRTLGFYLIVLNLHAPTNYLALPALILFYIGLGISFQRREFFFITWIILAYLIDTRGGDGAAWLAESMLGGMGLLQLAAWINRMSTERDAAVLAKRGSQALIFFAAFLFFISAAIADFQLINTSLKPEDLKIIEWAKNDANENKTFLLATGREFSMSDPMQEWFPALTNQHSATTLQGLEWTLGKDFFPRYEQLANFQRCADVQCVREWSARNRVTHDYLVVFTPPKTDESATANSLRSLATSAQDSNLYSLVYESDYARAFELKK